MEQITVYYDEQKESCRRYAEFFNEYEEIECKKMSVYQEESIVFESNKRVGFLFESEGREVSPVAEKMIKKLVISKSGCYFVFVTGGKRELRAAMEGYNELQNRGYKGANVYSRYYFEKYHMDEGQAVKQIVESIEKEDGIVPVLADRDPELSAKDVRKKIRKELKEYKERRRMGRKKNRD